ncbi:MAG: hypothetical protein JST80_06250 [Bdellovibrionales bacterium]|nr:hypothetical protein [Bdellovibrionales bacterium]
MKQFATLIAVVAMISSPAFAQSKKKTHVKSATPAASEPAATSSTPTYSYSGGSTSTSYSSGPHFSAAASLGAVDGNFFAGPSLFVEWPTNLDGNDFAFGAQTGMYFHSGGWTIPIMPTGKIFFRANGNIKPYVALSIGISITHYDTSTTVASVTVPGASGTLTKFALLARPGINFGEGDKFFAELPLGTMAGGFAIAPTFGYHF